MASIKSKWKRAPMDQRRLNSDRTIPHARFTRSQRSGSLPAPLPTRGARSGRPMWLYAGALIALAVVSIVLVIVVGTVIRAQQQYEDDQWRASYYGRPTLPFSTLAPDIQQQIDATVLPLVTTPLPLMTAQVAVASDGAAKTEPDSTATSKNLLSSYCTSFGVPTSLEIIDWNDWTTVKVDNTLAAQLPITWDTSVSFWRGDQYKNPYDTPADEYNRWRLRLFTADGSERWMDIGQSATTPDTLYVAAFQNLKSFLNGSSYALRPCRAFTVPISTMNILLSSAGAYSRSESQFPALAAADDPRWVRGIAVPLSGSIDLRSIPTRQDNQPIQTISQSISCSFITDLDWGGWAQIKLNDDTTGWVDTTTVRLTAS